MHRYLAPVLAIVLGTSLATLSAGADLEVIFTGTVTNAPAALSPTFMLGDGFSGSFMIDPNTPDIDIDPNTGLYLGAHSFDYVFDGYASTGAGGGGADSVRVANNDGSGDRFQANSSCGGTSCSGSDIGAYFLSNLTLSMLDSSASVFADDSLPTQLSITDFPGGATAGLVFQHPSNPSENAIATLDHVEIITAPEPSAQLLALVMLAALSARTVRRARRTGP